MSAPKEIKLPALDEGETDWQYASRLYSTKVYAKSALGCTPEFAEYTIAVETQLQLTASLTREREKDDLLRVTEGAGMFWKQRADDLQQRAEKAVEILEKATITSSIKNVAKAIERAIALLTAPKENSNAG